MATSASCIQLKVIIVGGGIGGLTAALALRREGHDVQVIESSAWLREAGAAVSVPLNGNRVLSRLGIDLKAAGAVLFGNALVYHFEHDVQATFGREGIGRQLQWAKMAQMNSESYQFIHRVDLHEALKASCVSDEGIGEPVKVLLSSRVVDWHSGRAAVTLQDGRVMSADIVVAADGVHSRAHVHVLGHESPAIASGSTNIRFMLPTQTLLDDQMTAKMMDDGDGCMAFYFAPDSKSALIRYPCQNNRLQNFGAYLFSDTAGQSLNLAGERVDRSVLREQLRGLPKEFQTLADKTEDVLWTWKIADREPLPVYHKERLVLLGDAAHPMWTFQGQGASQCIEDGAVLGTLLSGLRDKNEVSERLMLYDMLRVDRASKVQLLSKIRPEEINIEKAMPERLRTLFKPDELPATYDDISVYLWDYDCISEALKALRKDGTKEVGESGEARVGTLISA